MKTKAPVFAIVRFDDFQPESIPIDQRIRIVRVVRDQGTAESEVQRLTMVNGDKGCRYRWYATRLVEGWDAPNPDTIS